MVRSEVLRTDEADIEPPPIPTRKQSTSSSDESDVMFNSLPTPTERFTTESKAPTNGKASRSTDFLRMGAADVIIERNFVNVKTSLLSSSENEHIIDVVPIPLVSPVALSTEKADNNMAKEDRKDPTAVSNKNNEKTAEKKEAETTMLPKKKDTAESSSKKKWSNTFSIKKALIASTKGDRRDKKGASLKKEKKNALWEKKMNALNGFKEYGEIVGSIHQPTLYTFQDLLQPTGAASDETRSPASQKFIKAVSTASKKSSSNSPCNVLVLGNMHGVLFEGVKLDEALVGTRVGCGLAAGEVVRESVLYLPGADFVGAGGDPVSYPIPRDRFRDGKGMVSADGVDILGYVAKETATAALAAALRNKSLKRGAKKQWDAMHQKKGLQILDFDGKCFSVLGAETCNVEEMNRLGCGMLKTYPLTDSSVIEHMVALHGAWLDLRFRAFHEHQKYDAKLPIKLKRLRNTAVREVGYTLLKSPLEAIKLMDVCRLAGRFNVKAEAGDKFWVETVELVGWGEMFEAPQHPLPHFGPREFVDFLAEFVPEE